MNNYISKYLLVVLGILFIHGAHAMDVDSWSDAIHKNTAQSILLMFVISLSHILIVTDDIELHNMGSPLPLHQIRRCILLLKTLLYRACCLDDTKAFDSGSFVNNHFGLSLITSSSKLMRDLQKSLRSKPKYLLHKVLFRKNKILSILMKSILTK